jgi:hypothetical protein
VDRFKLYHLTPAENRDAILREGIRAGEDGAIYVFTHLTAANTIARDQVHTASYALFRIFKCGITGEVLPDEVGEFAAPFQRRILQARIEREHLRLLGVRDVIYDRPTRFDYLVGEQLFGQERADVRAEFAIRRQMRDAYLARSRGGALGPST